MKKIIVGVIICALMLPMVPQVESSNGDAPARATSFQFEQISVDAAGEWLQVTVDDCMTLQREGEPMLPYATHTMTFPLGTRIDDVKVKASGVEARQLNAKVTPAPKPIPLNSHSAELVQKPGPVYGSNDLYPSDWVQWRTGAGLHNGEHVTFLTLQAFPARYAPQDDVLHAVDRIEVTVTYEEPSSPLLTADAYDLLIITPQEFTDALQPLIQHKEDYGLATQLVTLDEIYNGDYFPVEGRDEPERVKYFIKNALEDWGISYALLVGDVDVFPTRFVVSEAIDGSFPSDLYYADVYHANGSFAVWDEDRDDTFGERIDDDID
ncbi:MAG: C25 family cysteine peptidase, partial [Thermoplasmatota archaeon]